ncbi:hypothetical protein CesoFtcFv8_026089 [Champsocephalus esox]|uniref:Uncharacterized protein n=1 Tax=Champsocephalus esox TaxID=159716 RepID=A0AAN8B1M7_9TELE|nr:hypothetical protein CesoFtcFv8_026089 [Champsocephalus esox]
MRTATVVLEREQAEWPSSPQAGAFVNGGLYTVLSRAEAFLSLIRGRLLERGCWVVLELRAWSAAFLE